MAAEHHNPIAPAPEGPVGRQLCEKNPLLKLLILATIALMPATASASTVFSDATLSLANYTVTPGLATGGASIITANCPTCGPTGGQALEVTGLFPNAPVPPSTVDTALAVLLNNSFIYTPSVEGAITSLSASVDRNLSVNIALTGGGNSFHPTFLQDGVLYLASISASGLNCPSGACATS